MFGTSFCPSAGGRVVSSRMHNQIRRVLNNGIGNRPRSLRFVWTVWNGCRRKSIPISAGCAGRSTIPGPLREQGIVAKTSRVLSMGAACIRRFRQDARRLPIQVAAPSRADTLPTAGPVAVASGPAAGVDPVGVRVSARSWWVRPEAQRCRRLGRIQRHGAHAGRSGPAASLTARASGCGWSGWRRRTRAVRGRVDTCECDRLGQVAAAWRVVRNHVSENNVFSVS